MSNSDSVVHVGSPSEDFSLVENTQYIFHDFANLPSALNEFVDSPEFTCDGYKFKWKLRIYRGGRDEDEEIVPVYLVSMNSSKVILDYEA